MKRYLFLVFAGVFLGGAIYFNVDTLKALFENEKPIWLMIGLFLALILFFIALHIMIEYKQKNEIIKLKDRLATWSKLSYHVNQVGDEVFNELPIGIVAFDEDYEIKWANHHAKTIFNQKIIDYPLAEISNSLFEIASNNQMQSIVTIKSEIYDVIYRPEYKFIYLFNVTNREMIKQRYNEQIPALGIIYLDNLEEAMASLDVSEQSTIKGEYLGVISDWVAKYDGYLKPYGNERLLVVTYRKQLEKMIEDKFDILDQIRNISLKNEIRISLSLGIASWDISYEELGAYAQNAIELAEKRGGDQVVVNIQNQKIAYFGAKLDASAKNSRVGARINAQTIRDLLDKAANIFIMGHDVMDADALGSAFAMYHMAKLSGKPTYIIMDEDHIDATVMKIMSMLKIEHEQLLSYMMTTEDALPKISKESMLVVVDTQSPKMVMSPRILEAIKQVIIVDHHRVGESGFESIFSYIEPYASSTIELLMELINFYPEETMKFSAFEASMMYAGLVVDTNNFGYRTGARTFEVAYKLKELGADTSEVKSWLRKDLKTIMTINRLVGSMEVYLDKFAFIVADEVIDERILIAQITDEALQVSDIDAAFTIAYLPNGKVGVSSRSFQKVNVQLLMEAIGGGGHLNSAAAQVEGKTVQEVYQQIKEYLNLEYGQGGGNVKIILLEDVKGKGQQDQIIDVANGYGQFLISQKKAVLATDEQIQKLNQKKTDEKEALERHIEMMKKIKQEIDHKKVTLSIQVGHDGKMFGSVTTKQICEAFEETYGIQLDKKKVELSSDINSIGIYTAVVYLYKDIKAQFEVQIIEK